MKIISLEVENVKRIKAVSIKPNGSTVIIGGENASGKSSTLDSIQYALGGEKKIPSCPLRKGKEKGKVVLDLDDIVVTRTFTEKGTHLVVKNKDGATFASPQSMLHSLVGDISFDPLEFSRMDTKKQLSVLKKLLGLDFDKIDIEYKELFSKRTNINRKGKEVKAQFDNMEYYNDTPKKQLSVSDLSEKIQEALSFNQKIDNDQHALKSYQKRADEITLEISKLQKEKSLLNENITKIQKNKEVKIDVEKLQKEIKSVETINYHVDCNNKKYKLSKELDMLRKESLSLTDKLNKIQKMKSDALSNTKFPINGLAFDENGVTFNGIPLDQCSSAEKIKISVSIGFAMNPKLKILLIRDGSLLDEKNLKLIAEIAEKNDGQLWIERVGEGKECQVVISDGSYVKELVTS